jgi:hypothetical protein
LERFGLHTNDECLPLLVSATIFTFIFTTASTTLATTDQNPNITSTHKFFLLYKELFFTDITSPDLTALSIYRLTTESFLHLPRSYPTGTNRASPSNASLPASFNISRNARHVCGERKF